MRPTAEVATSASVGLLKVGRKTATGFFIHVGMSFRLGRRVLVLSQM